MLIQVQPQERSVYTTGLSWPLDDRAAVTADTDRADALAAVNVGVLLERSPAALARVYSVLCLMNVVPVAFGGMQVGDDAVRIDFVFGPEPDRRIDLLSRKLAQLTECLEVTR
jgi:hypothetical protein